MSVKNKTKSLILFLIKLGIAGTVVYYFLLRNPEETLAGIRQFDWKYILAAALLYFCHMLVSAWRWGFLAKILGVRLGHFETVSLTMQGYFFSLVIPGGAIGGDVTFEITPTSIGDFLTVKCSCGAELDYEEL
jgi:uncharacterized membrane protein YbhN (UPF0104 family)